MGEVLVLDVGHGNSAIIRHDGDQVVVVDAPLRDHLVDALRQENVTHVRLALASHSDSDHCGGFIGLLLDDNIVVDEVRMNPDATRGGKGNKFWVDLLTAAEDAKRKHGTKLRTELTEESSNDISQGSLRLEILHPSATLALGGTGSIDRSNRRVSPNAMSAVVRVVLEDEPLVLLPGDLDRKGLDHMIAEGADLAASVVVFPHHGGTPEGAATDAKARAFTSELISACGASTVLFSNGRGVHQTPRPEIVETIRAHGDIHIACTQFSTNCSDQLLQGASHHASRYAAGRKDGKCCLGTAVLTPQDRGLAPQAMESHETAVSIVADRLCR